MKNLRAVLQFNIASDSFGLSRTVRVSPLSPLQRTLPLLAVGDTTTVELAYTLDKPQLWSAEKPNLYPFSIELLDEKGAVIEHFDYHFGVKKVEVVGDQWQKRQTAWCEPS